MARFPGATWRPLKENRTEPFITPTQLIFHSAVSKADSMFDWFNTPGVDVESHLYVQDDGDVEQYIDTTKQADANFKANIRAISVETWDNRNPDKVPWNKEQLQTLAKIAVWAFEEHNIPLRRSRFSGDPGIGGHTDFKDWSNVPGKTCPGLARRDQIDTVIAMALAMLKAEAANTPSRDTKEFQMDATSAKQVREIVREEMSTVLGERRSDRKDTDPAHISTADLYTQQEAFEAEIRGRIAGIEQAIAGLPAKLTATSKS